MNPHYFGKSEHPLFGIYYPARKTSEASRAVLICPPIAHEHIRTHWALRLLSQRLSREGIHTMRFDYTGIGDSCNWMGGVVSLDQWIKDVRLAAEDLLAESGCSRLSIVGLRMGAALATLAAESDLPIDHLVLWEPVWTGADYIDQMRSMHNRMVDLWVCPMKTEDSQTGAEILGFYYQRNLLNQIQSIQLSNARPCCETLTVIGSDRSAGDIDMRTATGRRATCSHFEDVSDWNDLNEIETAWLQAKAPTAVIESLKQPAAAIPVLPSMTPTTTMQPAL